jgi:hypothetical protein
VARRRRIPASSLQRVRFSALSGRRRAALSEKKAGVEWQCTARVGGRCLTVPLPVGAPSALCATITARDCGKVGTRSLYQRSVKQCWKPRSAIRFRLIAIASGGTRSAGTASDYCATSRYTRRSRISNGPCSACAGIAVSAPAARAAPRRILLAALLGTTFQQQSVTGRQVAMRQSTGDVGILNGGGACVSPLAAESFRDRERRARRRGKAEEPAIAAPRVCCASHNS